MQRREEESEPSVVDEGEIEAIKAALGRARAAHAKTGLPALRIVVDTAEKAAHDLRVQLRGLPEASEAKLCAGDVWILLGNWLFYVFERKTRADLSASSSDGRSKMQAFKLKQMLLDAWRILFIIEGPPEARQRFLKPESSIVGAQVHKIVRDRMGVSYTASRLDTAYFVLKVLVNCYEEAADWLPVLQRFPPTPLDFNPLTEQKVPVDILHGSVAQLDAYKARQMYDYLAAYGALKCRLNSPHAIYVTQLQGFGRLGLDKALAIARRFPTMVQLAAFAVNPKLDEAARVRELADLPILPPPPASALLPPSQPPASASSSASSSSSSSVSASSSSSVSASSSSSASHLVSSSTSSSSSVATTALSAGETWAYAASNKRRKAAAGGGERKKKAAAAPRKMRLGPAVARRVLQFLRQDKDAGAPAPKKAAKSKSKSVASKATGKSVSNRRIVSSDDSSDSD